MSRQQRDLIVTLVQVVVATIILFVAGNMAWNAVGPVIKQQMNKPAP